MNLTNLYFMFLGLISGIFLTLWYIFYFGYKIIIKGYKIKLKRQLPREAYNCTNSIDYKIIQIWQTIDETLNAEKENLQ